MKKLIYIILLLIGLTGCSELQATFLDIEIDENAVLYVGDVIKLTVNLKENITWETENPELATVDESGIVTALAPGIVDIIAQYKDLEDSLTLVIVEREEEPILLITGEHNLAVEQSITLDANVNDVEWTSSDEEIAEVIDGVVTGKKPGLVTINAYSPTLKVNASFHIYVRKKAGDIDIYQNIIENIIYELEGEFDLSVLSEQVKTVIENSKYAVVGVMNFQNNTLDSIGSGVIFEKSQTDELFTYTVLTNYHVIEDNHKIKVYLGYDDVEIDATVVDFDSNLDLAKIQFTTDIEINPLSFADPDSISIGDFAIAIGNPTSFDFFGTVTFGVISYPNRTMKDYQATFVQHDVAINPGNSGGPLIDMDGNIIGINTLKFASYKIDNLGFSINVETILEFLN